MEVPWSAEARASTEGHHSQTKVGHQVCEGPSRTCHLFKHQWLLPWHLHLPHVLVLETGKVFR